MYNSVTLRILSCIFVALSDAYKNSYTHKILKSIVNPIKFVCANSRINQILNGEKYIFRDSYFLKIYKKLFSLVERFMHFLYKILFDPIRKSLFLGDTVEVLSSFDFVMGLVSNIILWTGIFVLIVSIIFKSHIKLSLLILIFGFILSMFKGKYLEIINGSKVLVFILSFFKLDEGGEKWW